MKNSIYKLILVALFLLPSLLFARNEWNEANKLYSEKQYANAATIYEQLITEGQSPYLYYNYANTCYKMGDIGKSVLYYERALKIKPDYEDAKANLDFVNSQITDKIEPIQHFFLVDWWLSIGKLLTTNQWAVMSIITFIGALILLLVYVFGRLRWLRKVSFFLGILVFVVTLISMAYSFSINNAEKNNPSAIVMAGSVSVKSTPDQSGTELFVLHEGTKISIKNRLGQWVEIRLADGNVGWMPESELSII